ncbi:MAG: hypothetical protein IPK26_10990 [Planctomycetes bacterium]|nr:hypothetical protein [Planctomycetota bacterium]
MTFVLALASIGLSVGLNASIEAVATHVPAWVHAPSTMAVFGVLFALFDHHAWRWSWVRRCGIVKVCDLTGEWEAHVKRALNGGDGAEEELPATVTIAQSWRSISVVLTTATSRSVSISASMLVMDPANRTLSYEYTNEPGPHAPATLHKHRGTAVVQIKADVEMEGQYYTGRGRGTFGSFKLGKRR